MAPWLSPESTTERLHLFAAPCSAVDRSGVGGEDGEDGEVLELPFTEALARVRDGCIDDAETVLLLQWDALLSPFRSATGSRRPALSHIASACR